VNAKEFHSISSETRTKAGGVSLSSRDEKKGLKGQNLLPGFISSGFHVKICMTKAEECSYKYYDIVHVVFSNYI
jgi:hypothetical protein